jgi:hypothetical protein
MVAVLCCLLGAATPAVAVAPDRSAEEEETLWDFLVAPLAAGEGRFLADVALSEPVKEYPYEDDSGATTIAAFHSGDGWSAVVCEAEGLFLTQRFGITRDLPDLRLPIALGQTQDEVEQVLGKGVARAGALVYEARTDWEGNFHRATLGLDQGRVVAIDWLFEPGRVFCPHLDNWTGRLRTP